MSQDLMIKNTASYLPWKVYDEILDYNNTHNMVAVWFWSTRHRPIHARGGGDPSFYFYFFATPVENFCELYRSKSFTNVNTFKGRRDADRRHRRNTRLKSKYNLICHRVVFKIDTYTYNIYIIILCDECII